MRKEIIRRATGASTLDGAENMHPVLRNIYQSRQITSPNELERELKNLLPFSSMLGIDKAAELLVNAVRQQKHILIVGDFDADGATSTAIAMRALKSLGATQVDFLVPNRFEYGYGLTPELVAAADEFKPDMILTVDNGIANHAGVDAAKAKGIQVVITDHHLAADTLPNADAIVNPNQPGDHFPSKALAGCGVIFYVMLAVRRKLVEIDWFSQQGIPEPTMSRFLDLVALGTVADLVPLDHNNRILVHQGLRRIRAGQCCPGIIALLEASKRDFKRTVAADIGFGIAARLNAAGRLDDMSLGINCLLEDDGLAARKIARQLNQLNDERKGIESDMQAQALDVLEQLMEKLKGNLPYGLCLYDEDWHQGVIGILASRIKDKFHRPVIIFAPGQDGEIKGSARSITGLHIRDVLAHIDATNPGLIKKFGGHAMAAGLTIDGVKFDAFREAFENEVTEKLTEDDLKYQLLSDGVLAPEHLSLDVAQILRDAGPWGQAFPEPIFDDEFKLIEQRIVGDKHLKLKLAKDNKVIDAIHFFADIESWPNHRCEKVHVAYKLDINEYNDRVNLQLIVEHLEPM